MSIFYLPTENAVFIHIPKTGGTSVRKGAFSGRYRGPVHGAPPKTWPMERSFAFVRNPYDRIVSAQFYINGKFRDMESPWSIERIIEVTADESINCSKLIAGNGNVIPERSIRHHCLPQTHPYYRLNEAQFIGRFENLEEDFHKACRWLDIEELPLPQLLKSARGPWERHLSVAEARMVEEFYREDFETLKYDRVIAESK